MVISSRELARLDASSLTTKRVSRALSRTLPAPAAASQPPALSRCSTVAFRGIADSRSIEPSSLSSSRLANTTQPIRVGDMIGAEMAS